MSDHRSATVLRRALGLALAVAFAGAGALSAQGHGEKGGHDMMKQGHDMHAGGMQGGHGAMLGHVPTAILHQAELLELSDGQRERVKALKDSVAAMHGSHAKDRGSMHESVESAFTDGGIDVEAYESALRSMADRRVAARVEVARLAREALRVLDDGQREKFLYGVHLMHRMHRMHHGGHGAMDQEKKMRHGGTMKKHREMEREEKEMTKEKEGGGR